MKYTLTIQSDEGELLLNSTFSSSNIMIDKLGALERTVLFKELQEQEQLTEAVPF